MSYMNFKLPNSYFILQNNYSTFLDIVLEKIITIH